MTTYYSDPQVEGSAYTTLFEDCDHADYEHDEADPSVGIFGEQFYCPTCGATADHADEEWEVDEDFGPMQTGISIYWQPAGVEEER